MKILKLKRNWEWLSRSGTQIRHKTGARAIKVMLWIIKFRWFAHVNVYEFNSCQCMWICSKGIEIRDQSQIKHQMILLGFQTLTFWFAGWNHRSRIYNCRWIRIDRKKGKNVARSVRLDLCTKCNQFVHKSIQVWPMCTEQSVWDV